MLPKTALNGPAPCVSSPLAQACGGGTSYTHFSNISWTPRVLDPITNPFLGPSSWLHPASLGARGSTRWHLLKAQCMMTHPNGLCRGLCSSISLEATGWANEEDTLSNLFIQFYPPLSSHFSSYQHPWCTTNPRSHFTYFFPA